MQPIWNTLILPLGEDGQIVGLNILVLKHPEGVFYWNGDEYVKYGVIATKIPWVADLLNEPSYM